MIQFFQVSKRYPGGNEALKDATLFSWSGRWGTPFWTGPGYALPGGVLAWSWSVVSPVEDGTWTDPAGNRTAIGAGKVSHVWGLRGGGRRLRRHRQHHRRVVARTHRRQPGG